jgi:phytoene desaturase
VHGAKEAPGFRKNVLDHVEKLELRDLRRRIRFEKIVTPDDWDSSYEVHNGAKFNMAQNSRQMLH